MLNGDGNENGEKTKISRSNQQKTVFARAAHFAVAVATRLKAVGFFLKISKEIGKAWRGERKKSVCLASPHPVWHSVFSPVPDLLFDCSRVFEHAKNTDCFAVHVVT